MCSKTHSTTGPGCGGCRGGRLYLEEDARDVGVGARSRGGVVHRRLRGGRVILVEKHIMLGQVSVPYPASTGRFKQHRL